MAIMGQVLVFRFARETIVRSLDMEGYSAEELQEIRGIIIAHTWKTIKPDPVITSYSIHYTKLYDR